MLKIVVIGAGGHSRQNHLPALKKYLELCPGEMELSALCDLNREQAEAISKEYGFKRFYTDIDEMLSVEKPDGCIAITPHSVTKNVVSQIIPTGIPLLMEKPLGATLEEARDICAMVEKTKARVMVSMNRRFNPVLTAASSYITGRPLEYMRTVMLRHNRTAPKFFFATAIHAVDAMRHIAGDVKDYSVTTRKVDGINWYNVQLFFESGTYATLEVMPTCGCVSECYEMFGPDYRVLADVMEDGPNKATFWDSGQPVQSDEPAKDMPDFVKNGTYAETMEFISSIKENRAPYPVPKDVLQSAELCYSIQKAINTGRS